jgi:hypothetical protein
MTTEQERTATDIEALERAFNLGCEESEAYREHLERIARQSGWDVAAENASYHFQCRSLALKPWEAAPSNTYASSQKELTLRQRLLRAGLSLYEPFPTEALKEAERRRRARRAEDPKGESERDGLEPMPEKPAQVS